MSTVAHKEPSEPALIASESGGVRRYSGNRWVMGMLAFVAAYVGSSYHFVMEDKFAPWLAVCVAALALTEADSRRVKRTLSIGAVQLFVLFVAYYAVRFDGDFASRMFVDTPERISREAVVIGAYLAVLVLVASGRPGGNVRDFMVVFTISALILEFYGLLSKTRIVTNPNIYAYQLIGAVPVLHLALPRRRLLMSVAIFATAVYAILGLGSRTGFLALLVYLGAYWCWPAVSKSRRRVATTMSLLAMAIVVFMYLYLFQSQAVSSNAVVQRSEEIADKSSLGRLSVWVFLVSEISQHPWWGRCSNCNTEYFYEPVISRNLSSHNEYLEVSFRMGLVGLTLFLGIAVALAMHYQRHRESDHARIGFSFLTASLWTASSYEYIIFTFLTAGLLYWIAVGLVLAHAAEDPAAARSPVNRN